MRPRVYGHNNRDVAYVLAYFGEDIATATTLINWALELKPSFASG
jgi:hypothetical protein